MKLRALIFDVDGTLAETEEAHREAFNRTFAAHGIDWDWSREDYRWLLNTTGGKERMRAWQDSLPPGAPRLAAEEIAALRAKLKERDDELSKLRLEMISGAATAEAAPEEIAGVALAIRQVPFAPVPELRNMADTLRSKLGSGVVVLGAAQPGKVILLAAVSPDLKGRVHAGDIVKASASVVGGGGGGRPDFAQAGGKDADKLGEALDTARTEIGRQLGAP